MRRIVLKQKRDLFESGGARANSLVLFRCRIGEPSHRLVPPILRIGQIAPLQDQGNQYPQPHVSVPTAYFSLQMQDSSAVPTPVQPPLARKHSDPKTWQLPPGGHATTIGGSSAIAVRATISVDRQNRPSNIPFRNFFTIASFSQGDFHRPSISASTLN